MPDRTMQDLLQMQSLPLEAKEGLNYLNKHTQSITHY